MQVKPFHYQSYKMQNHICKRSSSVKTTWKLIDRRHQVSSCNYFPWILFLLFKHFLPSYSCTAHTQKHPQRETSPFSEVRRGIYLIWVWFSLWYSQLFSPWEQNRGKRKLKTRVHEMKAENEAVAGHCLWKAPRIPGIYSLVILNILPLSLPQVGF